jgi:pseudaminic acid biosynthesis-associated methylase
MEFPRTEQEAFWTGEFGTTYIERNCYAPEALNELYSQRYGITRSELNHRYLGKPNPSARLLEVGANIGNQLSLLRTDGWMGELYGIEINRSAIGWAHENRPELDIVYGSAMEFPFRQDWFDVVIISGVLIHIAPEHLSCVFSEVARVLKPDGLYMGLEYWAPVLTQVKYRGHEDRLWKCDFAATLASLNERLHLVSEEKLLYKDGSDLIDQIFVFRRIAG